MPPLLAALLLAAAPAPWHLPDWKARAVVEVVAPAPDEGVDVAGVRLLLQGAARPDGADLRVIDDSGRPVPFQATFLDPARAALVSFRCPGASGRFFVYFDNPTAPRAAEEVVADPTPGASPPVGRWVPSAGFVLSTWKRPDGPNPKTVAELAALRKASPGPIGARYQRQVAEGSNPFGASDNYLSVYRGWIRLPTAGTYQFCTASNEASFSFLDGKDLVHWPGRHTVERGLHGEKNAKVELSAGLHYLEYVHEEVTLQQMAYLGWRPSADEGPFGPIPEGIFTAPHRAEAVAYESPAAPLPRFEPAIVDSIWPAGRHEGQYTRAAFRVANAPTFPAGTTFRWELGDGQSAEGPAVEHVYLTCGPATVALRAEGPSGMSSATWPLDVFEIEHVTDAIPEGKPADYARIASTYDLATLAPGPLAELAHLRAEADDAPGALAVGRAYVERFASTEPTRLPAVRRLMAECALRSGDGGLDEAIASYRASITDATPRPEALDALARLARLVGIDRGRPADVPALVAEAEAIVRRGPLDDDVRSAFRRVVIASGDARLWEDQLEPARAAYRRAEVLGGQFLPPQVRAARVGAYPDEIAALLASNNPGAALDLIDQWEETFPTDKPRGESLFWRGKALSARGQDRDAARQLARAVGLAAGAGWESEARWRLAGALKATGKSDDARKELARLVATGLNDRYARLAREKLAEKGNSR